MARPFRRRYLAFVVEGGGPLPDARRLEQRVLAAVRPVLPPGSAERVKPRLYVLRRDRAVLRVEHVAQDAARRAIDGLPLDAVGGGAGGAGGAEEPATGVAPASRAVEPARVRTVTTSGTLRQAKLALGVAAPRRPRRPPRGSRSTGAEGLPASRPGAPAKRADPRDRAPTNP